MIQVQGTSWHGPGNRRNTTSVHRKHRGKQARDQHYIKTPHAFSGFFTHFSDSHYCPPVELLFLSRRSLPQVQDRFCRTPLAGASAIPLGGRWDLAWYSLPEVSHFSFVAICVESMHSFAHWRSNVRVMTVCYQLKKRVRVLRNNRRRAKECAVKVITLKFDVTKW